MAYSLVDFQTGICRPKNTRPCSRGSHGAAATCRSLFHPNSGHVVHDHFRYATWVGRPWPLNVEPLLWSGKDPLETCNEWECYFGTSGGWGE